MKKLLILFLFVSSNLYSQEFEKGKTIFDTNCASCHKMDAKLVGPPLQDVVESQGREWTQKWIYNSQVLIESGDAHAKEIYNEYNQMAMPSYSWLAEDELSAVIDYLEGWKTNQPSEVVEVAPAEGGGEVVSETNTSSGIPTYIWVIIIITLVVLLLCAIVIVAAIKILDNYFTKMSINNSHLMKKLNLDDKQVETEVDTLIEKEVSNRVNQKLKVIKTEIDKNFKK